MEVKVMEGGDRVQIKTGQEQLETFQAGKEQSLVGLCRLWGDQDQESPNTVIVWQAISESEWHEPTL